MKVVLFALYYAVSVALLMWMFRVDEYLRNFRLGTTMTIGSYFVLGFLLSVIAVYLAPWLAQVLLPKLAAKPWPDAMATATITLVLFCIISLLFGPWGVDIPGTRIRGIFFAEFKFVNFVGYVGVLLAMFGGVLRRLAKR